MFNTLEETVSQSISNFPFSAVAGQEQFKLALLLAAVNPLIGGVLVSGPRGSAKSTLAKGLADIMPAGEKNTGHFVTLPLGASEEMLIGTLNLQQVLNDKKIEFQPGLLAKAHGGILYVDEVNLLPDNLVDQLLDVAASGVNIVERDGVSHQHHAEFILLGTMNPDEGELRPQLTDRFGLSVELSNRYSLDERMGIVLLREGFDKDPKCFLQQYAQQQTELSNNISKAKVQLNEVRCPQEYRRLIAEKCQEAQVDGLRGDIVWVQAVLAKAALEQRTEVTQDDVLAVEELVLAHRRNHQAPPANKSAEPPQSKPFSRPSEDKHTQTSGGDWGAMDAVAQHTQDLTDISLCNNKKPQKSFGSNHDISLNKFQGNAEGERLSAGNGPKINWFSTLLANAGEWPLDKFKYKPKRQGCPIVHVLLLDTSGSILANRSFAKAKGLILQISEEAYLEREQVMLIGFGNQQVQTLLGLRRAPKAMRKFLDNIKASGGTPLADALSHARDFQQQQLRKMPSVQFKNYIITDGRVSDPEKCVSLKGEIKLIDVEQSTVKRGKGRRIADLLNAQYYPLYAELNL
ncbi:MAG: VWA domain-containing protein [Pseudomonadales bacterium]|nr:VWA domain-containing protein [Pseudomonadales bacterium]